MKTQLSILRGLRVNFLDKILLHLLSFIGMDEVLALSCIVKPFSNSAETSQPNFILGFPANDNKQPPLEQVPLLIPLRLEVLSQFPQLLL